MAIALKTADVRTRIEEDLKEQAVAVLADCGLSVSEAVRLFLRQVVKVHGLPFEVKTPNTTTRAAMEESRAMMAARRARFSTPDAMFDDLEKASRQ